MDLQQETDQNIETVKQYFTKGDAGDPTILDLFTEDVEIRFPKFGTRSGKAIVPVFVQGLFGAVQSLIHYPDQYTYLAHENFVIVEGWESGVLRNGRSWPSDETSDGKFCNVFRFRNGLISQVHIYVDPDFGGSDRDRFYWA